MVTQPRHPSRPVRECLPVPIPWETSKPHIPRGGCDGPYEQELPVSDLKIPADLLPSDGRFGCGPSKVRPEAVASLL